MSSAPSPTFKTNVLSVSLLGRRGVSVELGANPSLRKGSSMTTIHEIRGLYCIDLCRSVTRAAASIYTVVGAGWPRSHGGEDNDSCE